MILAAGLTPAWQRILTFDSVRLGAVNRAARVLECAGGKAANIAAALGALGARTRLLTPAGGERGALLVRWLRGAGVDVRAVETASETRTCTTLLEKGRATELVEKTVPLRPEELRAFHEAFAEEAPGALAVALSGSLPEGTPETFYRDLVSAARGPVILDARGPELLEALSARPFLVKPNRRELAETLGTELHDRDAVETAMARIVRMGASWAVVTDGSGPVLVHGGGRTVAFQPPESEVVNPIGCGDCLAAGIAFGIARGRDPLDAVRFGIAAAADKLTREYPAAVDPGRAARLAEQIRRL